MNTFNNKNSVILIAGIMVVVATAFIFFVPITLTSIIAYIFTMLAIAMFCGGSLYMLNNPQGYPWLMAFPITIWQYLLTQLALSATFVVRSVFFESPFHVGLFLFLHILLLGIFSVKLLMIKSGKEIIEQRDAEIKQHVFILRMLQADVESLAREFPEHEKPLRQVAEALRYSDPISNPAVALYEEQIQRSIIDMQGLSGNNPANIPVICEKLMRQITDRNSRVKMMKQ